MPYLIDGHNLIPKIPGLSLQELDDEQHLIELLQEFCRLRRKQAEVYFDQAATSETRAHRYGLVIARFVRQGVSADQAIRQRLERLGRSARNWTVVSSDMSVQADARAARARILSAEEFSELLGQVLGEDRSQIDNPAGKELSEEELEEWLHLFGDQDNP